MSFTLKTSESSTWKILHLQGRVDAFNDREVIEALRPLQGPETRRCVLELGQCESLNLKFLRELIHWAENLRVSGGELILMAAPVSIKRSLEIFVGRHRIRQVNSVGDLSLLDTYGDQRASRDGLWSKTWAMDPG